MTTRRPIRIANCSGFYGDRLAAAKEMVEGGPIDVLSGDWLAELTMGILLRDRMKDPARGYARTLLPQLRDVLGTCLERGIRVVTNAGGTNPKGLAEAVLALADDLDLPRAPRVAVLLGDELTGELDTLLEQGALSKLDGTPWAPGAGMPMGCNAYLGAHAVAEALQAGADVVITGRCTDAALVVGPAAWWHGWAPDDYDALAGALVAGHIIECGTQATGGNYSFFEDIPGLAHPGFPLAEIASDGHSVITKHPGTGGAVTVGTVTAQLLYEVGDARYLSPDVVARLDTVQLQDLGEDRVAVTGTRGEPPPATLKAGILSLAGHRHEVVFLVGGDRVEAKAAALEDAFWAKVGGKDAFAEARCDVWRGDHPDVAPWQRLSRVVMSAADPDAGKLDKRFKSGAVELALASVPGLTLESLPGTPRPVVIFEPVLVPREHVRMALQLDGGSTPVAHPPLGSLPTDLPPIPSWTPTSPQGPQQAVVLGDLCAARSGDKAGDANVGFFCPDPDLWPALQAALTEPVLREALGGWTGAMSWQALPNLRAINVVLHGWLGRGVAANLAPDPQAKGLAEALRTAIVNVPAAALPDGFRGTLPGDLA